MSRYDDTLTDIKSRTVFALATDAECGSPDHDGSAGASFLRSVRDALVEAVEQGRLVSGQDDDTDVIHEIANDAPDVYTSVKWNEFVDLEAYNEDPSDYLDNGKITDMGTTAGTCLFIIAERLCWALLGELTEARNEDVDDENEVEA